MSDWKHGLSVARREFYERVRTKWFLVSTVLGPLAMVGFTVFAAWLGSQGDKEQVRIEMVDESGVEFAERFQIALALKHPNFEMSTVKGPADRAALQARLEKEQLEGYLLIPRDVLTGGLVEYRGANASNLTLKLEMEALVTSVAIQIRAKEEGLTDAQIIGLFMPVKFQAGLPADTDASLGSLVIAGYIVMFVLYMAIIMYGANVLRSVVMEKTNRVVELIVSAIRPRALLFGKLFGVGSVGLVQLGIWGLFALVFLRFREPLLAAMGVDASNFSVPPLSAAHVVLALVFFLLGFFFYSSLFAAIGAMVSSEEEAQQAQTPLVSLLILPAVCVTAVADAPSSTMAQVFTQIPFISPVLMPMRVLLSAASPTEIALSIAILLVSIGLAVAVAGKIYRVGILMYGKRPSLRELGRWLTHK